MCGLIAVRALRARGDLEQRIRQALSTLSRRGPNAEGLVAVDQAPTTPLGHRHLAILDPRSAAEQPMRCPVFNGAIYNFVKLREELCALGCVFITDGDTEVLLHFTYGYQSGDHAQFDESARAALLMTSSGQSTRHHVLRFSPIPSADEWMSRVSAQGEPFSTLSAIAGFQIVSCGPHSLTALVGTLWLHARRPPSLACSPISPAAPATVTTVDQWIERVGWGRRDRVKALLKRLVSGLLGPGLIEELQRWRQYRARTRTDHGPHP